MKKTAKIKVNEEEYEIITDIIYQVKYNLLQRWIACTNKEEKEKLKKLHNNASKVLDTIENQTLKTRLHWQYRKKDN